MAKTFNIHRVNSLPSTGINGDRYILRKSNNRFEEYIVAPDGTFVFQKGITDAEQTRLLNDYTNNQIDNKIVILDNKIDDLSIGINGSVTTSMTLAQLNALADGVYEAQTTGTYANGLIAKESFITKFKKTGTVWTLHSETQVNVNGVDKINPVGTAIPKEKAVADYVSPIFNTVDLIQGKNLFNPLNKLNDKYFRTSDNTVQDNSSSAITVKGWEVYNFKLGSTYTYSGFAEGTAGSSFFLDENNNFIASTAWSAPTTTTRRFTVPNNPLIKKIWFNIPKDGSNDGTLQLEEGMVATSYEPYLQEIVVPAKNVDFEGSEIQSEITDTSNTVNILETNFNSITELGEPRLTEVYEARPTNGYINIETGQFVASTNWRATIPYQVQINQQGIYEGYATAPVCAVMWYDINMENPIPLLSGINGQAGFIVPANGYIVASYKAQPGDIQSLKLPRPALQIKAEALNVETVGFMPKKMWGQVGQEFRMYPCGIVPMMADDTHLDFIWSLPNGNRDFIPVIPNNTNDIILSGNVRNGFEVANIVGTTTIKVTKAIPTNPVNKQYILCLGDSLTQAGKWVAELMLRVTGTNTFISPNTPFGNAVNNITPLNLTNIEFIGKRITPNTTAPREGNGGWAYKNWLNNQNFGGNINRFWNPSTQKFDLNYYLTTEGYSAIDATGSNLTIYTMCMWNSVYLESVEEAINNMDAVFQIIHSQRPDVKIKVIGLNTPPSQFMKAERGGESPNTVMRDIIAYNKALEDYAELNSGWVEFICLSAQFHPEGCYPNTDKAIHLRASDIQENYATDHVHPNDRGYAQIADAAYYNLIYNYCN